VNAELYKVETPDPLSIRFEFSDGRTAVKKSFQFSDRDATHGGYLVAVSSEVTLNGVLVAHSLAWRGGFGDQTMSDAAVKEKAVYYDVPNSKLNEKDSKEAKSGPVSSTGSYSFEGVDDNYFAGV